MPLRPWGSGAMILGGYFMLLLNDALDRNVRTYPQKTALVYNRDRYTYAQLGEKVNRFSNALTALGIGRGDRVALLSKNCADYLISLYGIFQAGAVVVPLNFRLQAGEAQDIIERSDAKAVLCDPDFISIIEKMRPKLNKEAHFIMMGGSDVPEGYLNYDTLLSSAGNEKPVVDTDENDVAVQMYTSGTTGLPKGALLTHRNLVIGSYMGVIAMQISFDGCSLIVAPMFHIAAAVFSLTTVLVGGTNIIQDNFNPQEVLKTFEKEKISHGFFAPIMIQMLLGVPGVEKYDYSSLNTLCFGGAPIDYNLLVQTMEMFKCDLMQGFGQTEACPFVATMSQEEYRQIAAHPDMAYKLNAVGKEFPNIHMRIVDENDNDVPVGAVGEIVAQGENIMIGYYNDPEATEATLKGGWLHTGDIGRLDEDGYLYLMDRCKDMIISGAENVYCIEVETVLAQIPEILEAVVVGKPDEKWGEIPKAFVVKAPGADLTEEAIITYCRDSLAHYKCPKEVEFMAALPRSAAGKVMKRKLRKTV